MTVLMILAFAGCVAGAGYWVYRARPVEDAAYYVVRCHACDQKVRYPARKAGCMGHCPRCMRKLSLPETSQPLRKPTHSRRISERLLHRAS